MKDTILTQFEKALYIKAAKISYSFADCFSTIYSPDMTAIFLSVMDGSFKVVDLIAERVYSFTEDEDVEASRLFYIFNNQLVA